jgi:hypothetical protein
MIQSPEALPRHIKSITEVPIYDTNGAQHSHVTVEFRWWYRPIAWWVFRRLRPIAAANSAAIDELLHASDG